MLDLLQKHGGKPSYTRGALPGEHRNLGGKAAYIEINKARGRPQFGDFGNVSGLIDAIRLNHLDRFQKAVLMGEDVNQRDQDGRTPLHICAVHLRETMMMTLLKQKAEPDLKDRHGYTAF